MAARFGKIPNFRAVRTFRGRRGSSLPITRTSMHLRLCFSTLLLSLAVAAPACAQQTTAEKPVAAATSELKVIDVKSGEGKEAVVGKAAMVQYTGWVYDASAPDQHGKKFDSSLD